MLPNTRSILALVAIFLTLVVAPLMGARAEAAVDREVTPEEEAWLADVQAEIDANGYSWTAGPTSVSHLSPEARSNCWAATLRTARSPTSWNLNLSPKR